MTFSYPRNVAEPASSANADSVQLKGTPIASPTLIASEIMTAQPVILHSSDSIEHASATFFRLKITSSPVVSLKGEVIGQLTELGLLRALVMHQLQPNKFSKLEHCGDFFDVPFFVAPGDPISVVIRTMIKCPSRRILVRNARKDLLGIISPKDLLRLLKLGASGAIEVQKEIKKLSK